MQGITQGKPSKYNTATAPIANLKDLARISGFSISTVSKALNNSDEISTLTKKKLRKLAVDHNYIPNKTACALRKQKTDVIIVCLPKQALIRYAATVEGIIEKSQALGYQAIVHQFELKQLPQTLRDLELNRDADGIVLLSSKIDKNMEARLENGAVKGLPIVKHIQSPTPDNNVNDQRNLGKKLCKTLLQRIDWKCNSPDQFSEI